MTKEEEDIDILHSWMEVGGQPALPEGEAQVLLAEVSKSSCPLGFATKSSLQSVCVDCHWLFPPSLFNGVRLLQSASSKREEARRLETEAQQLETEGWGKLREAVIGSEAGFYGLLRGVTLHSHPLPSQPPPSRARLSPSSPVFQQSPQESAGPEVSGPVGPVTASTLAAATPAPGGNILADM